MAQHTRKGAQFQAVTANRLNDGIVVYLTAGGRWSESLQEAAVAEGKEAAEALLARAEPAVADNSIVEPYLFEVARDEGGIRAASVREVIRQAGPTVRLDLGKQAELPDVHR
ncbi:DUF2849 domain-containing protein [Parvibaculum sp.]|uniref:DUF2849 domain-containing protein n=1 Tax=Parvibaculum sp. TaxID=2024848 RepID=UPI002730D7C8|nr:DUF2849 domain-containing protein [Parvibaculum sp.]MDP1627483.1 DUF2849 domain-containing protein [Parvibaculum sp.]MDP2148662.1 DUF2849 domain-containing protein [Parvibaculum sp.]MDP3326688.1 DUF2849 domain-containing protein [Parvibaculum sp.]